MSHPRESSHVLDHLNKSEPFKRGKQMHMAFRRKRMFYARTQGEVELPVLRNSWGKKEYLSHFVSCKQIYKDGKFLLEIFRCTICRACKLAPWFTLKMWGFTQKFWINMVTAFQKQQQSKRIDFDHKCFLSWDFLMRHLFYHNTISNH